MKVFLLGLLAILSCGGYKVYQTFGPPSAPYKAYQRYADAEVNGGLMAAKHALGRFGAAGNVPDVTSITYQLESQSRESDTRVRVVAVQYVQRVYRGSFGNPAGRPKVSKARHHALVELVNGDWKVTDLDREKLN